MKINAYKRIGDNHFGRDVLHAGLPMDTDYDNSSILSLDYKWSNIGGCFKIKLLLKRIIVM
jgi:hypothetical protein